LQQDFGPRLTQISPTILASRLPILLIFGDLGFEWVLLCEALLCLTS